MSPMSHIIRFRLRDRKNLIVTAQEKLGTVSGSHTDTSVVLGFQTL